jgi:hypothetical protein
MFVFSIEREIVFCAVLMNTRARNRPQELLPMGMASDEYSEEAFYTKIRLLGRGDSGQSAGGAL